METAPFSQPFDLTRDWIKDAEKEEVNDPTAMALATATAEGAPRRENGRMRAPHAPGLGVQPRTEVLGEPVAKFV